MLWLSVSNTGATTNANPITRSSSSAAGTKNRFRTRSLPFGNSTIAPAAISSALTAPAGTSPPTCLASSEKLGFSSSNAKSRGLPPPSRNAESECHSCSTRAGRIDCSDLAVYSFDSIRCFMRATSFLERPVRTATRETFVVRPLASGCPSASSTNALLAISSNCEYVTPAPSNRRPKGRIQRATASNSFLRR